MVEEPEALRHDQQDRGPEVVECPDERRRLAADRIDDARAHDERRDQAKALLVEVRERKNREKAFVRPEIQDAGHRLSHGDEPTVRQHRALRLARRAAREDDLGEVVSADGGRLERLDVAGTIRQRLDEHDREAEEPRLLLRLPACQHHSGIGLAGDLRGELVGMANVERHRDCAEMHPREPADRPLGSIHGPHDVPVPAFEADIGQDSRRPRDNIGQVAVAPDPRPESGPDQQRRPAIVPSCAFRHELDQRVHRVPSP
jgi:hypothetical protein